MIPGASSSVASLTYPASWRSVAADAVDKATAGASVTVFWGAPGHGKGVLLDLVRRELAGAYEHVLRMDGDDIATTEVRLRLALERAGIELGPDTFASARAALAKEHHLALLLDRAGAAVLDALVTPELRGAVIATTTSPAPAPIGTLVEVPEYPARRAWNEVRRRREERVLAASSVKGPVVSAIHGLSLLADRDLRDLVEAAEADQSDTVQLRHLAGLIVPRLSPAALGVLRALTVLGPGRTEVAHIGSIPTGRMRNVPATETNQLARELADLGLIGLSDDIAYVDEGLVSALDPGPSASATLQRAAVHLASQLRAAGIQRLSGRLTTALRVLRWADARRVDDDALATLREHVLDHLVDADLHHAAIEVLSWAAASAARTSDHEARAHLLVDAGLLHRQLGDLETALTRFHEALSDFGATRRSQRAEAITLANIGTTLQRMGRHEDAIDTLDRARAVLQRSRGDNLVADLDLSIGLTASLLATGQHARARAEVNQASDRLAASRVDPELEPLRRRIEQLRGVLGVAD